FKTRLCSSIATCTIAGDFHLSLQAALKQLSIAEKRTERSTQLVTGKRHKFILEAVELLHFLPGEGLLRYLDFRYKHEPHRIFTRYVQYGCEAPIPDGFLFILSRPKMNFWPANLRAALQCCIP